MEVTKSALRKEKLKKASHILAGVIMLVHAYEKYESGHGSYIFFAIAGLVFISITIFHHQLLAKFPRIDFLFFAIEATLSFIVAFEYFHMGKTGLPFMYLFAGLIQMSAIFMLSRRSRQTTSDNN